MPPRQLLLYVGTMVELGKNGWFCVGRLTRLSRLPSRRIEDDNATEALFVGHIRQREVARAIAPELVCSQRDPLPAVYGLIDDLQ
jgi:hypothetical protein